MKNLDASIMKLSPGALLCAVALCVGCPKPAQVPVSFDDEVTPYGAVSVLSNRGAHSVTNSDGPIVVDVRRGQSVVFFATTLDSGGVRSTTANVVSGGMIKDGDNLRGELTRTSEVTEQGTAPERITLGGELVFDAPNTNLVIRSSGADFAGNTVTTPTITLVQHDPPIARVSADRSRIDRGQSVRISYETENADEVTLDGQPQATLNGSQVFTPTQTTEYVVEAKGAVGRARTSVVVTVDQPPEAPIIDVFRASAASVEVGQPIRIRWETRNTTSVTIASASQSFHRSQSSGQLDVTHDSAGRQTYQLTATGPGGTMTATTTFDVNMPSQPPPSISCHTLASPTWFQHVLSDVTGSLWVFDASLASNQQPIVNIKNETSANIRLTVNNRTEDIRRGETSSAHAGLPFASRYVLVVPNFTPSFVKIEVCRQD